MPGFAVCFTHANVESSNPVLEILRRCRVMVSALFLGESTWTYGMPPFTRQGSSGKAETSIHHPPESWTETARQINRFRLLEVYLSLSKFYFRFCGLLVNSEVWPKCITSKQRTWLRAEL